MKENMSKWPMTDDEIKRSYRCCKDANAQIGILAELNCRKKAEVRKKLAELGVELARTSGRPSRYTEEERRMIYTMRHDEGRPYQVIARHIGRKTSNESIRNEYLQMHRERLNARPLIEKAVRAYIKAGKTTESEAALLRELIKRGI